MVFGHAGGFFLPSLRCLLDGLRHGSSYVQLAMPSRWLCCFLQPGLLRLPFADDVYVLTCSCCVKRSGLQQDVHSSDSGRGFEPSLTCLDPTVLRTTRLFRPNPPGLSRWDGVKTAGDRSGCSECWAWCALHLAVYCMALFFFFFFFTAFVTV